MPQPPEKPYDFSALVQIVAALRGPQGCPWDKEQTHHSLTRFAIEEAHELAEAIETGDKTEVCGELGDLLLQVVLHSEIARQAGEFNIEDVINQLCEKMLRRHPHVFSDVKLETSEQVNKNWEKIKQQEKQSSDFIEFNIPNSLPALMRSQKIGEKTKKYNFDWSTVEDVVAKVEEELGELKEAVDHQNHPAQEHEVGDLLFSVAQLARHLNLDAEQALRIGNKRFEERFEKMQIIAKENKLEFEKLSSDQLEELWIKAKKLSQK